MKYYTVIEVATLLKVNKFSVYRWIKEGRLERIVVGRTVRITEKDLHKFLNRK